MRSLATLPKVDPGAFSGQRQGWKTPRGPHWQCTASVCSGSALLGDLLEVSRSREHDLLSVLSIYPRFFFWVFIVYCRVLLCYMLMNVYLLFSFSCQYLPPSPFRLAALFCGAGHEKRRWEQLKLCGIYTVHWKFSMCTATRTSSYSPVGPSVFFFHI